MSDSISISTEFINMWLEKIKSDRHRTNIVNAVAEATKDANLDEAKLIGKLRELSKSTGETI